MFLMHGLFGSSADYILMGPNISLGYLLADEGYDVWLGNSRGNRYSQNHLTLNRDMEEFWDFSFHEIGVYDCPAIIDYILNVTNQKSLHYVGHSQGTSVFLVLGSERPEYMSKIRQASLLSPVAFIKANSLFLSPLLEQRHVIQSVVKNLGLFTVMTYNEDFVRGRLELFSDLDIVKNLAGTFIGLVAGYNPRQMDPRKYQILFGHAPSGAAVKQLIHYLQLEGNVESEQFGQYDYGPQKNLKKYKSKIPPRYNLANVTAPMFLYYSLNDMLVGPSGVRKLGKHLPNLAELHLMKMREFNHMDFVAATDVRELLYYHMVKKFNEINLKYQ